VGRGCKSYNPHGNEARDEEYRTFDRKWRGYPSGYRVESHQDKQLSEAVERHLALEFWRIQDA